MSMIELGGVFVDAGYYSESKGDCGKWFEVLGFHLWVSDRDVAAGV